MGRVLEVGVSAWSYLNAVGQGRFIHEVTAPCSQEPPWHKSGLSSHPPALGLRGKWGKVRTDVPALPPALLGHKSRAAELLVHAAHPLAPALHRATERYGAARVGIVIGSSTGGIDATERAVHRIAETGEMPEDFVFEEAHVFSALVSVTRALYGLLGPAFVVSTACSSSGKALAAAQRLITAGHCDAVLTAGADGLSEMTLRGFAGLSILSPDMCKPFDGARDGISLGEGAALILLERDTDSPFRLCGVGESSDAYHLTAPHPDGLGARLAMQACLSQAGLDEASVDYVNAHGTGTLQNDSVEAAVIDDLFGPNVPFSSTKDRTGHQLGTAGATEAVFSLIALEHGQLPPNRPAEIEDQTLRRQPYRGEALPGSRPLRVALSNSFAFGGSNVCVGLRKGEPERTRSPLPSSPLFVLGAASFGLAGDEDAAATALPPRARGRASPLTRIFAELFGRTLGTEPLSCPLFFGSAYGEMSTTIVLLDQMIQEPTLSPAKFQASVHNTAAGLLSIATGNQSSTTAIAAGDDTVAMTLLDASAYLACHGGQALVLVADEPAPVQFLRGQPFPALGVGFLLSSQPLPTRPALARLGHIAPSSRRVTRPEGIEAPESRNPAAWGLSLSSRLAPGSSAPAVPGVVAVAPSWELEVLSL